jgi:hypothetical protein
MRIGDTEISKRDMTIGGLTAGLAVTAFMMVKIFSGEDMQLGLSDRDYGEKCYSYNEDSDVKSQSAHEASQTVLALLSRMQESGRAQADNIVNRGYGFCFDMNDDSVQPTGHWNILRYYFSQSDYPQSLFANYIHAPFRDAEWNARVIPAEDINSFTFESGLLFSRAQRAVKLVLELSDIQHAIREAQFDTSKEPWKTFVSENPSYRNVVDTFVNTFKDDYSYTRAMDAAARAYLTDAEALMTGDKTFLNAYLEHVSVLEQSTREDIYDGPEYGDYAIIDADRDGARDDVIYMGNKRTAIEYYYDAIDLIDELDRQYEMNIVTYSCGTTDKPQTCTRIETESVERWVNYNLIPAPDTGTLDLAPQTLTSLAALSGESFWNAEGTEQILLNEDFLRASSTENANTMLDIHKNVAANIPGRDFNTPSPGLGLIAVPK